MLDELWEVLAERKRHPGPDSYTAKLLEGGQDVILRKLHEETLEVTLAATSQGRQRLIEEAADLLYHLLVLLLAKEVELSEVWTELKARRGGEDPEVEA